LIEGEGEIIYSLYAKLPPIILSEDDTSQDSTTMDMTDEGTVLGTAGYMPPSRNPYTGPSL
jgi:hypothetical protein